MNTKILIPIILITLTGYLLWNNQPSQPNNSPQSTTESPSSQTQLITPQEYDQLLAENPNIFVLDVHTPEQTHIPGTDAFIDYTKIKDNQDQLPTDKTTPIIAYCRSGSMSAQASQDLVELGYTQVYDLQGGTDAYKKSGTQLVTITPDTQPLGTVIYGNVPETQFTLTNYTDQTLNITRLSTSCGCTKAFMDHREIQPFTSAPVHVTFNPAIHGDDTDLGDLTRTIYIETDNPKFDKLEVTITANVVKN